MTEKFEAGDWVNYSEPETVMSRFTVSPDPGRVLSVTEGGFDVAWPEYNYTHLPVHYEYDGEIQFVKVR